MKGADKLLITAAAVGTRKTKAAFKQALNNALQQAVSREKWEVSFIDSAKDPLLWAADYCSWAIITADKKCRWPKDDNCRGGRPAVLCALTILSAC